MEQDSGQTQILFVSVPEAARRLGIGKALLYQAIHAGKFRRRRMGSGIVVSIRVLENARCSTSCPQRSAKRRHNPAAWAT
jgi:excisionase family DNA binding protein